MTKKKKANSKLNEIKVPILNDEYCVFVIWGNREKAIMAIKKYYDEGFNSALGDLRNQRGVTFYTEKKYPIIWLDDENPYMVATLAHEAVHAVGYIFDFIHEESKTEVFAHSVGAIVREFLRKYKK